MALQAAEKLSKYGHSEEAKTTKNLYLADSYEKQVLRFAQNDREKYFFSNLFSHAVIGAFVSGFSR